MQVLCDGTWCEFAARNIGFSRSFAMGAHVSMDHGFIGEEESEEHLTPVLVIRERRHKMTFAMLVTRKETDSLWIAKRAAKSH